MPRPKGSKNRKKPGRPKGSKNGHQCNYKADIKRLNTLSQIVAVTIFVVIVCVGTVVGYYLSEEYLQDKYNNCDLFLYSDFPSTDTLGHSPENIFCDSSGLFNNPSHANNVFTAFVAMFIFFGILFCIGLVGFVIAGKIGGWYRI